MQRRQFLSTMAGGMAVLGTAWVRAEAADGLRAGEGVADITPPLGIEMAGFHKPPGQERRIEAIRQSCEVRALVLTLGSTQVAICSLDALCTRYGVDRSHRVKHGALLDAELLAQVYVELTGGRQIGLELAGQVELVTEEIRTFRPQTGTFRPARPHTASAEELARHAAFLESLTTPIWLN